MSRKIIKITLKDGGIKGAVVRYERKSLNKTTQLYFRDKYNTHYGTPVNSEITEVMESFKADLVSLCNLNADIAYEDIKIIDVEAHDGWFKIGAKVRSVGITEYIARTPKIEDGGEYDTKSVTEKISALYREVNAYIKEKKVADPKQLVMEFSKSDKSFDEKFPDGVEAMDEQQQADYFRTQCEKRGMIVIEQEVELEIIEEEDNGIEQHEAAVAPVRETPGKIRTLATEPMEVSEESDHSADVTTAPIEKFGG